MESPLHCISAAASEYSLKHFVYSLVLAELSKYFRSLVVAHLLHTTFIRNLVSNLSLSILLQFS